MNPANCPGNVRETIDNYVRDGVPPGDFVQAVLENNLVMAFSRADVNNRSALGDIVAYLWNEVPATLWGSREVVQAHIKAKLVERSAPLDDKREVERMVIAQASREYREAKGR